MKSKKELERESDEAWLRDATEREVEEYYEDLEDEEWEEELLRVGQEELFRGGYNG